MRDLFEYRSRRKPFVVLNLSGKLECQTGFALRTSIGFRHMYANLWRDLSAIMERDPAASNRLAVVFLSQFSSYGCLSRVTWSLVHRISLHCSVDNANCADIDRD